MWYGISSILALLTSNHLELFSLIAINFFFMEPRFFRRARDLAPQCRKSTKSSSTIIDYNIISPLIPAHDVVILPIRRAQLHTISTIIFFPPRFHSLPCTEKKSFLKMGIDRGGFRKPKDLRNRRPDQSTDFVRDS